MGTSIWMMPKPFNIYLSMPSCLSVVYDKWFNLGVLRMLHVSYIIVKLSVSKCFALAQHTAAHHCQNTSCDCQTQTRTQGATFWTILSWGWGTTWRAAESKNSSVPKCASFLCCFLSHLKLKENHQVPLSLMWMQLNLSQCTSVELDWDRI